MTTATETEAFTLHPDAERAFWALADHLMLPVTGSALTLVRQVVTQGRQARGHEAGYAAALELLAAMQERRPVRFNARPRAGVRA